MAKGPVCSKCPIAFALKELVKEYQLFIELREASKAARLTAHASGFCQGMGTMALDVIDDIQSLVPYLQAEADLRAQSDKGI